MRKEYDFSELKELKTRTQERKSLALYLSRKSGLLQATGEETDCLTETD